MTKDKPFITYLNMSFLPVHVGVATDKKSYEKEIKRLNVTCGVTPWDELTSIGCTMTLERNEKDGVITRVIWVVIKSYSKANATLKAGLAAHEASHVVDSIYEYIGEKVPSSEFKAYLTQHITQGILQEIL